MTSHYNFQILPLGQIQWKSTEKKGPVQVQKGLQRWGDRHVGMRRLIANNINL